jgi:glycosyltransferase involved in cell wall biosynthesis
LAVQAFQDFGRNLLIVGSGPELGHLKSIAPPNVSFVENASDKEVTEYMRKCRALIFPGEEDFGIVPLEAQACGKSVIAFGKGGALETVINYDKNKHQTAEATGILFYEQSSRALKDSMLRFEKTQGIFNPHQCRKNALKFDRPVYQKSMKNYIQTVIITV